MGKGENIFNSLRLNIKLVVIKNERFNFKEIDGEVETQTNNSDERLTLEKSASLNLFTMEA